MTRFLSVGFALLCGLTIAIPLVIYGEASGVAAKSASASPGSKLTPMRQKAATLIRQDMERASSSGELKISASADEQKFDPADAITMAPFIVTEEQPLTLPPPEKPIDQFFRTGSLIERKGSKVTTRLWMKGDKGLMLSFDF